MLLRVVSKHKKKAAIEKMLNHLWTKHKMDDLMALWMRRWAIYGSRVADEAMEEALRLKIAEIENDK
jgi:hypothetical protein